MKNRLQSLVVLFLLLTSLQHYAQEKPIREKFIFEFGLGGGVISLENSDGSESFDKAQGAGTFPDLKVGYMVKENLAVTLSLPGMIYTKGDFDRHFGGIVPGVQYWFSNKWWINGGFGLAIDGPALYDISTGNKDWNYGKIVTAGIGYEVYQKEKFAINLQSKLFMGRANIANGQHRDAVSFSVGVGFNWF